jgi:hypothetical protein
MRGEVAGEVKVQEVEVLLFQGLDEVQHLDNSLRAHSVRCLCLAARPRSRHRTLVGCGFFEVVRCHHWIGERADLVGDLVASKHHS